MEKKFKTRQNNKIEENMQKKKKMKTNRIKSFSFVLMKHHSVFILLFH